MTHLHRFLDDIDQRRGFVKPEPRKCACCGESGDFDDLFVIYPQEHHAQMATRFGGEVCTFCLDEWAACDNCGNLDDDTDIDGLCPECSRANQWSPMRPVGAIPGDPT